MKSIEKEKSTNDETDAYVASVMDKRLAKTAGKKIVQISDATATPIPTPAVSAHTLKSIIKRAAKEQYWYLMRPGIAACNEAGQENQPL